MDELKTMLQGLLPAVDFDGDEALVDDGVLDSLDIVSIISEISSTYGLQIPPEEIVPENFNSVAGLYALIQRLEDQ